MQLNKVSVDDINVKGKKVLVRVDFNVPLTITASPPPFPPSKSLLPTAAE